MKKYAIIPLILGFFSTSKVFSRPELNYFVAPKKRLKILSGDAVKKRNILEHGLQLKLAAPLYQDDHFFALLADIHYYKRYGLENEVNSKRLFKGGGVFYMTPFIKDIYKIFAVSSAYSGRSSSFSDLMKEFIIGSSIKWSETSRLQALYRIRVYPFINKVINKHTIDIIYETTHKSGFNYGIGNNQLKLSWNNSENGPLFASKVEADSITYPFGDDLDLWAIGFNVRLKGSVTQKLLPSTYFSLALISGIERMDVYDKYGDKLWKEENIEPFIFQIAASIKL